MQTRLVLALVTMTSISLGGTMALAKRNKPKADCVTGVCQPPMRAMLLAKGKEKKQVPTHRKTPQVAPSSFAHPPKVGALARCPVMGTIFRVKANTERSSYKKRHYVFCCPQCKPLFDANPAKFLQKQKKPSSTQPAHHHH